MQVNTNCKDDEVFKTTTSGWSGNVPVCKDKFIEVNGIELSKNDGSIYKVSFKADDVMNNIELKNLVDEEQVKSDAITYFITVSREGIPKIPFYADVQIGQGSNTSSRDNLLQVKYRNNANNQFMVSVEDNLRTKYDPTSDDNKTYPAQKLYLLKTDIKELKTYFKPPTAAGGRKSRRTINRKRRAVRKRRNTKRHSKTYRR